MNNIRRILIAGVMFLLLLSAAAYGVTWSSDERLTNNAGASFDSQIAVDGQNIYVVWTDSTSGIGEIYFKKSADGGATWNKNKRLINNAGYSYGPAIAVDGQNIYVVWPDDTPGNAEIYFKTSDDGGATWTTDKRLTNNAGFSGHPAIAVDGQNIYVVWDDDTPGNSEVYFKQSDDGGATWTTNRRLTNNAGYSALPTIAVNGQNIYVVWFDDTPGNGEIYFRKSGDGGATWTKSVRFTNNPGYAENPIIAVDGQNVYVVWLDDTPADIYFKKSGDGGATWTANRRLTNNAGASYNPKIAVNGQSLYVVWYDDTPGNFEIYFKKSADRGATWTTNRRLTNNAGFSGHPAIAADGQSIYVVWDDDTPGNSEIYFKKGDLF